MAIDLALWESNYYRFSGSLPDKWSPHLQLHQVYLRYQGTPVCNSTFEINDSAIRDGQKGFTSATYPEEIITGNTITLGTTDPFCVIGYSCEKEYHFAVELGHWFGQNWIHVVCKDPGTNSWNTYDLMLERALDHAQPMNNARPGAASCGVRILQTCLPQSTWILQTSCVMWKSSKICGIKLEVFWNPGFSYVSGAWTNFAIGVSRFLFVHAPYDLIHIGITNREHTIPTVTGEVS